MRNHLIEKIKTIKRMINLNPEETSKNKQLVRKLENQLKTVQKSVKHSRHLRGGKKKNKKKT